MTRAKRFLSTFPLRGTSLCSARQRRPPRYFYPRSPCGERPMPVFASPIFCAISIHVPLAGNVPQTNIMAECYYIDISIHVPLAGNVTPEPVIPALAALFLSTFPLRGTSADAPTALHGTPDFYPRSPCGERHQIAVLSASCQ